MAAVAGSGASSLARAGASALELATDPMSALETPGQAKYSFLASWLDEVSGVVRDFNVSFWTSDSTVEMYDPKARRLFLKRTLPRERVTLASFALGNTVTVMGRPLQIKKYLNPVTEAAFKTTRTTTVCVIKPDALPSMGTIIDLIVAAGLDLVQARMVRLNAREAEFLLQDKRRLLSPDKFKALASHLTRDACLALAVAGDDSVAVLHKCAGPSDPEDARAASAGSIRARFGTDSIRNAVHTSADIDAAGRDLDFLFEQKREDPALFDNCAVVVVKPHAFDAGATGPVLQALIDAKLEVCSVKTLALRTKDLEDFLEAYKGVVPEYGMWVRTMSEGRSLLVLVRGEGVVTRVRKLCGPYVPEIARELAPSSLRAQFGKDAVRNGVHCTDLERDGPLEGKFLFNVAV